MLFSTVGQGWEFLWMMAAGALMTGIPYTPPSRLSARLKNLAFLIPGVSG